MVSRMGIAIVYSTRTAALSSNYRLISQADLKSSYAVIVKGLSDDLQRVVNGHPARKPRQIALARLGHLWTRAVEAPGKERSCREQLFQPTQVTVKVKQPRKDSAVLTQRNTGRKKVLS